MKAAIAIILIIGASIGAWSVYQNTQGKDSSSSPSSSSGAAVAVTENDMPKLHPAMEESLRKAKQRGPAALKQWLAANGRAVPDPRLAWVQLEYVVLVGGRDIGEARRVFAEVKSRVPTNSVIMPRIQKLEPSFGTPR